MRHLPVSIDLRGKRVVIAGGGETALAKARLVLKTEAALTICAANPSLAIRQLAAEGRATLIPHRLAAYDLRGVTLLYAAMDDPAEDSRVVALGRAHRVLTNSVDNRDGGDFLTPAIVDRAPITIAIGTEGAAPVLARMIKAAIEARLPACIGALARLAEGYRGKAAALPAGARRRRFWRRFFADVGPRAYAEAGAAGALAALDALHAETAASSAAPAHVDLIGAGPGDPDLLTLKARRLLFDADVVIHDRLVPAAVLDLARREARFIAVGKTPGGQSWRQDDINNLLIEEARRGQRVVRLKSGDPGIYGRLDEETAALEAAGVAYAVVPGVTAAMAAAAAAKVSLSRRGRNSSLRILTGQDINGFAEHDWRALARPGATAAIYMGVGAAPFLQGRLLMHGADPATPMGVIENASRPEQVIIAAELSTIAQRMAAAAIEGPAILLFGVAPKAACLELAAPEASPIALAGGR